MSNQEDVKKKIEVAIPGAVVYVLDPQGDDQHLKALVVSEEFKALSILKQQQKVMGSVKELFQTLHALELKTFTPEQWEKEEKNHVR